MKLYHCWRCEIEVPMLDEEEWEQVYPLLVDQLKNVKEYRGKHGVDIQTAMKHIYKPATEKYFELTGFKEINQNAIWHHRLSDFGQECPQCGHLYRTAKASYCANCGHGAN